MNQEQIGNFIAAMRKEHTNDYYGFIYALSDHSSQQIIYAEIIFCNYYMDIDYKEYIPAEYLPNGFDATPDNTHRREKLGWQVPRH